MLTVSACNKIIGHDVLIVAVILLLFAWVFITTVSEGLQGLSHSFWTIFEELIRLFRSNIFCLIRNSLRPTTKQWLALVGALVSRLSVSRSTTMEVIFGWALYFLSIFSFTSIWMSLRMSSSLPAGHCPCCASALIWSVPSSSCSQSFLCSRLRVCPVLPAALVALLRAERLESTGSGTSWTLSAWLM